MSAQRELLGAFPEIGPLPYLHLSEPAVRPAIKAGPYPAETTWFHATYADRLPLIARTGLILSCWWGGDSCAIFGVDNRDDIGLVRRGDPIIEVRSCALAGSVRAWWVPPFAIQGIWFDGARRALKPERLPGPPVWPGELGECGCELTDIVREQQQL